MKKPRSIFLLDTRAKSRIYSDDDCLRIHELTQNDRKTYSEELVLSSPSAFGDVEIIFSGWGAPVLSEDLLNAFPNLKAFFYGAGSVRKLATPAFWQRDILLTSAYQANAIPVAEYTVASAIFALKQAWRLNRNLANGQAVDETEKIKGVYFGSKVGVISLGAIGQLVCQKLQHMDLDVYAYDPYADASLFESCCAKRVDHLETIFSECDVVTLHTPWLRETENMITGSLLQLMPTGACFINTSRGAIVRESEMIEVLRKRADIFAVIDVIRNESTYHLSELATMPNVFLTPHIAGSNGYECHRMGSLAVEECRRFLSGKPPQCPITEAGVALMA
ncbi:hydroxyacid dehydrogenase [Ruficoccus sp. ZRK36]|uniref:hydroxyacid dehydrogenase n=1 Tax=Ruficoccus sp. ZRK36 TaxID=2866311 RepID=UPI001C73CA36|nr:hydroxyacid dehydrogenase [Ruficoccus sp. ZRK36]QYY37262.1 hydroxyacid dehydrogenase [Ruficoccus sp. ZRK36]